MVLGTFAETKVSRRAGAKPGIIKSQNNIEFGEGIFFPRRNHAYPVVTFNDREI
jgi:hypothetical protein